MTLDEQEVARIYESYIAGDIADPAVRIESLFVQEERSYLVETLVALGLVSVANQRLEMVPGAEPLFQSWARSGGFLRPWEGRVTRAGRRRRRVARGMLKEWEASGHLVGRLPALIEVHPSRLRP